MPNSSAARSERPDHAGCPHVQPALEYIAQSQELSGSISHGRRRDVSDQFTVHLNRIRPKRFGPGIEDFETNKFPLCVGCMLRDDGLPTDEHALVQIGKAREARVEQSILRTEIRPQPWYPFSIRMAFRAWDPKLQIPIGSPACQRAS